MRKPYSPTISMISKVVSVTGALAITVTLTACAATSSKPKTSLWKITSPQRTIYIASDPQMLSANDYPLPKSFIQTFTSSSELYVEHIPTPGKEAQAKIHKIVEQHGVLPEDKTLEDLLTQDQLRSVRTAAKDAGIPFSKVKRVPPWRLAMALGGASPAQAQSGITPKEQLTYRLFLKAKNRNMPIIPLESYTELFKIVYSLPEQAQVGWLMLTIKPDKRHDAAASNEKLVKAWRSGDTPKVAKYAGGGFQHYPKLNDALVINRNRRWVHMLEQKLRSKGKPIFVVVGDGHLMGHDNMLSMLREGGYQVRQL